MMCFDPRLERIEQALIPIDLSSGKRKNFRSLPKTRQVKNRMSGEKGRQRLAVVDQEVLLFIIEAGSHAFCRQIIVIRRTKVCERASQI